MIKHADDDPVMYRYASSRNASMRSPVRGEELGLTWGEWREMSEEERNGIIQETVNGLVEVWIEDDDE